MSASSIHELCQLYVDGRLHQARAKEPMLDAILLSEGDAFQRAIDESWVWASTSDEPPRRRLTWHDAVIRGLHPVNAARAGIQIHFKTEYGSPNADASHPLNIALMFSRHLGDIAAANLCIIEYEEIVYSQSQQYTRDKSKLERLPKYDADTFRTTADTLNKFWRPTWYSPDPAENGLLMRISKPNLQIDNIALLPWFSKEGIEHVLTSHGGLTNELADAAMYTGRDTRRVLEVAATRELMKWWSQSRQPSYEYLAALLRMAPRSVAEERIRGVKGTRRALGICRQDAPTEVMRAGLSEMAASPKLLEFSTLYGRAPTVDELVKVRSSGIVTLLYAMPFVLLQEVLEEDQAPQRLRARLLAELGTANTEQFRSALSDNPGRKVLKPYPSKEKPAPKEVASTDKTTTHDWDKVFSGLAAKYAKAVRYREHLQALVSEPAVRATITSLLYHPEPRIMPILQTLPRWTEIEGLLKGMAVP